MYCTLTYLVEPLRSSPSVLAHMHMVGKAKMLIRVVRVVRGASVNDVAAQP